MKYKIVALLFISIIITHQKKGFGSETEKFYQFYIKGDMKSWALSIDELKSNYEQSKKEVLLEELVIASYGLIGYYLGKGKKEQAEATLKSGSYYLELLNNSKPNNQSYQALKGAFIGFELGLNPWKAPFIGPESQTIINDALKKAPNNPQTNFEYANLLFWSPKWVGGDKQKALSYYKKTISLLEQNKQTRQWYYLWAYTAYANALKTMGCTDDARKVYQQIAAIEPEYQWVKEELLKEN
ncbi:MAG: tetratricopeptide repeat protein [Salinivirgaceae bacterium]